MRLYEITNQLNEIIDFDEGKFILEMLVDANAEKVRTFYVSLATMTSNFTIHPKIILSADDIEDFLFESDQYYNIFKLVSTFCPQSIRMLHEIIDYLNSYYY